LVSFNARYLGTADKVPCEVTQRKCPEQKTQ
jgi:hypothetical protein